MDMTDTDNAGGQPPSRAATWAAGEVDPIANPTVTPVATAGLRYSVDGPRNDASDRFVTERAIENGRRNAPSSTLSVLQQSRNRGYSMRRALFAQNIQKQQGDHGTVMELEAGPSSSSGQGLVPSVVNGKEKGPTVITIEETSYPRLNSTVSTVHKSQDGPISLPVSRSPVLQKVLDLVAPLQVFRERLFGPTVLPPTVDGRHVRINVDPAFRATDERTGTPYISNTIRSCKYTIWNFVPKQLVAQFGKLANFYFLIISILQMIPGLSTTGSYTTIIPLLIFVSISMAKEGYEDIRRNRLDKEDNESTAFTLTWSAGNPGSSSGSDEEYSYNEHCSAFTATKWKDIRVGQVLLFKRDAALPADVVLLHSSGSEEGATYIETMSLDGETNLKCKKPLKRIAQHCQRPADLARLDAEFVVEDPNLDLYKFDGRVSVGGQTLPLTSSEVIYRGSVLRNTSWALGLVVYSGEECKIRMNANKNPRVKAPTLQAKVNRVVMIVAALVLFMGVILSLAHLVWRRTTETTAWYLHDAAVPFGHILTSFVIMLNTMLPLSLYVSLEIVKVAQMFMMNDIDMYDPKSNTPVEPKTSTLNEELGQINYIFSDKTGTLTDNSMKFRKLSVAGSAWLHDYDLLDEAQAHSGTKLLHKKRKARSDKGKSHKRIDSRAVLLAGSNAAANASTKANELFSRTGRTDDLLDYIERRPQSPFARKVRFLLLALALCHTCIPEKDEQGEISFQASSPDELALVSAAHDLGYTVTARTSDSMTIKSYPNGEDQEAMFETYQILDVMEFSSARKRMSIIVRLPDGRICLFCKGADTTIQKMLRQADLAKMHIADIKRVAQARKSMEAQAALRRASSQFNRKSITSPTIGRQSSMSLGRRESTRESVDLWLKERESTVAQSRKSDVHYAPRSSEQHTAPVADVRQSSESNHRKSLHQDDDVMNLVDDSVVVSDSAVFQRCFNHIDDFATEGLRTLVYGHRFLTTEDYEKWKVVYHAAATSLVDRRSQLEKAAELIEQNLELTGATAIEDKLQAGVPDAIDRFRRAGIKMWMLTGDKRETAINIGHSCHLIQSYSNVMILDHEKGDLTADIHAFSSQTANGKAAHSVLIVDGQSLMEIDADVHIKDRFTKLAIMADSVICCRASPSQKAGLVHSVRSKVKGSVTLAIGDGANDIAMIREAHVGIGIAGKEGLQAARTADYSIAQFRFLLKLLLVHGRWNYVRVCKYTLGTFWKEMVFYLVQATYQRWNGYTGTSLYEPWSLSMFNTLFTSLPVIFMGVFEKDLSPATLLAVPELYCFGQQNRGFNIPTYIWWACLGAMESQIVYFTMYGIYGQALFTKDQRLFAMGSLAFTACVTLISLKLQFIELHNKSIAAALAIFLSIGGWWLWNLILTKVYNRNNTLYTVNDALLNGFGRNILWWMTLILIVLSVCVLELLIKAIRAMYFPSDVETFQILERDLDTKKRFEESASSLLQQGWERGSKRSSLEVMHEEEEQARREAEVQDILDRPRTMDNWDPTPGIRKRQSWAPVEPEMEHESHVPTRKSLDVGEIFSKGFGMVRKGSMK